MQRVTRQRFMQFFRDADANNDGVWSLKELTDILKKNGYGGSDQDIELMFRAADKARNGVITSDEFLTAMGLTPDNLNTEVLLRKIFFKHDRHGDGFIWKEDLPDVQRDLNKNLTQIQTKELADRLSINNASKIDYEKFIRDVKDIWTRKEILDMFFKEADVNKDRHLTMNELVKMMRKLNYQGSDTYIRRQFQDIDSNKNGLISYEDFMTYMGETATPSEDRCVVMRRIFQQFDKNRDGVIDKTELKTVFTEMGKHFTDRQVDKMISSVDTGKKGGLNYEQFIEHIEVLLTEEDAFERFFREADADSSNYLTFEELAKALRKNGYKGTDADIKRMFGETDFVKDDRITFDEYMKAMGKQPAAEHRAAILRRVFQDFDQNGDGRIDKKELKRVFEEMDSKLTDKDVDAIMSKVDTDKSGSLDYEEFIHAVMEKQNAKKKSIV